MAEKSKSLEELVKQLPPASQQEIRNFVEFLLEKNRKRADRVHQDWAGLLRDQRDKYTS